MTASDSGASTFSANYSPNLTTNQDSGFTPRVWAPRAASVDLELSSTAGQSTSHEMFADAISPGWWTSPIALTPGQDYSFALTTENGEHRGPFPDPRSALQPHGVDGPSRVVHLDPGQWTDSSWTGRQLPGSLVYELHIGTFSPEGTFDGAITHLDHLVELGVGHVEVMPINSFSGSHGWGYDGVGWYAVHAPYGGPEGFQRFVDACHQRGLAVIVDVVYNHLGPAGNYLPEFGPYHAQGGNSWGANINLDGPNSGEVREFIVAAALRWFTHFHVDGLRLDAVHALIDHSAIHILEELSIRTQTLSAHCGRPLSLIAESDLNDSRIVTAREGGGLGLDAQWDDDVHHAIHAAVSGERTGYFCDFGSLAAVARVLTSAFEHAGTFSRFRGRRHGRTVDTERVPLSRFLAYTTTHDQVGNRAAGDRPSMSLTPEQQIIKAALVLLSPMTPMLFMGEEWGASTPFCYFTSHVDPALGTATAEGRKREFAAMGWDPEDIADPQDPNSFTSSKLRWAEVNEELHGRIFRAYKALVALRSNEVELTNPWAASVEIDYGSEDDEANRWLRLYRGSLVLLVNVGSEACAIPVPSTVPGSSLSHESGLIDIVFRFGDCDVTRNQIRLEPHSTLIVRTATRR